MSHRGRQVPEGESDGDPDEPFGGAMGERSQRRPPPEFEDDPFDIPPWSQSRRDSTVSESRSPERGAQEERREQHAGTEAGRGPGRNPLPQLGAAFERRARDPRRSPDLDPDDRSSSSVRDPYDRLRRVAGKPPRPITYDDEAAEALPEPGEDVGFEPVRRRLGGQVPAQGGRRAVAAPRPPARTRPSPSAQIGGILATTGADQRAYLATAGVALLSLTLMAATLAGRGDALADWLPIHFNAEGEPDRWGSSESLWRLPLLVVMLTLMSIGVAWLFARRDRFAAKFAVVSTLLVHACAWIALLNLAW